ncbi:MAG: type II toxin-antitoxin system VapC family toxin [Acidimicrobiaceae bacterium]|nr:type II toxin-antitoxin system VapC family toxin [Acidimicrobiaceae bacterium]
MYLLDTNIVSELRRTRPHPSVVEWVQGTRSADMFLSAVTVGEIQAGIEITCEQDPTKAEELEAWLGERVLGGFDVLAMNADAWREWARLMHRRSDTLLQDAMIAAIAKGTTDLLHPYGMSLRVLGDTARFSRCHQYRGLSGPCQLDCGSRVHGSLHPAGAVLVTSTTCLPDGGNRHATKITGFGDGVDSCTVERHRSCGHAACVGRHALRDRVGRVELPCRD